jgi:hypothetical protein
MPAGAGAMPKDWRKDVNEEIIANPILRLSTENNRKPESAKLPGKSGRKTSTT